MARSGEVRRRRRLLDVESIVDAAIAVVDETGSLTMADLAGRLGSSASSIYHHVSGRTEVLALVRDRLLRPVASAMEDGAPWTEQVATWLRSLREHLAQHPRLVPVLTAQEVTSTPELAGYDRVVALLKSVGFPDEELILWVSVLDEFAIGSALDLSAPEQVWQIRDSSPPALSAALRASPRGRARVEAAFELGLAALLAGMERRLAEHDPDGRPSG